MFITVRFSCQDLHFILNSANVLAHLNKSLHTIKFPLQGGEFYGGGLVAKSCPILVTPWTIPWKAPLFMGFSRQEYWSMLPFPSPGDLPDPGIEPWSPALLTDSLPTELWGKLWRVLWVQTKVLNHIYTLPQYHTKQLYHFPKFSHATLYSTSSPHT